MKNLEEKTCKNSTPKHLLRQNRGQLVVEYVLILFVAVTVATLLSRTLVGRDDNQGGIIINKWQAMVNLIGQDLGD